MVTQLLKAFNEGHAETEVVWKSWYFITN